MLFFQANIQRNKNRFLHDALQIMHLVKYRSRCSSFDNGRLPPYAFNEALILFTTMSEKWQHYCDSLFNVFDSEAPRGIVDADKFASVLGGVTEVNMREVAQDLIHLVDRDSKGTLHFLHP